MNAMDIHKTKLAAVCRLCRMKLNSDPNYVTKKSVKEFQQQIKEIFNHDIKSDDENQYPQYVCNNCRRRMQSYIKDGNTVDIIDIAEFPPHSVDNCHLCFRKSGYYKYNYTLKKSKQQKTSIQTITALSISTAKLIEVASKYEFTEFDINEECSTFYNIKVNCGIPLIEKTLKIFQDFSWCIYVFNKSVAKSITYLKNIPDIIDHGNVELFFAAMTRLKACPGNDDFPEIVESKLSFEDNLKFYDKSKNVKAFVEAERFVNISHLQIIRSANCEKAIEASLSRCAQCGTVRRDLLVQSHRLKSESILKEKTPNIHLDRGDLIRKCEEQHSTIRNLKKTILRRDKNIENLIKNESVELGKHTSDILEKVLNSSQPSFERDSPKYLLWQEQLKFSKLKKKTSMRWHPLMIRWCLSIYLKSPAAYDHLRNSGFIELPHKSTLNSYTSFYSSSAGFKADIINKLCTEIKVESLKDHERQVILKFDEMKIKKGLVFCRSSGELRGFTELGEINKELEEFDSSHDSKPKEKDLASYVICFMVGGLLKRFSFPMAYFSSLGFSSDQLFSLVWESIGILETIGLEVMAVVCDGASPNRRFFKMHKKANKENVSDDGVVYWSPNRYDLTRKVFFFSDPPHLIKTIRNNIENSGSNAFTRCLQRNGLSISWQHIVDLYEYDLGKKRMSPGIRKLHKLTEDHISLTPRLRMRVNLAVQVLSNSVAKAMASRKLTETKETEKFISLTDTFFDCLNVVNTFEGQKTRKPALFPYRSLDDWRFKWLKEEFLKYVNDWKTETDLLEDIPREVKAKYCLSAQTIEGLRLTVHSFIELVPIILNRRNDGSESYFLSGKLNQDDVEEHFGRIRMRGGGNENPTASEYGLLNRKVIVAKSDLLKVTRGNTRGRQREETKFDISDERQLPKRTKKK